MGANKKSKWGMAEALKILKSLDISEREKLLETMGKSDPEMASALQSNLLDLEDLIYLTPKMLVEFMREVRAQDLGLALRMASSELKGHFLKHLSSGLRKELEEQLMGPPRLVRDVEEARRRILAVMESKLAKGEIVLNKKGDQLV